MVDAIVGVRLWARAEVVRAHDGFVSGYVYSVNLPDNSDNQTSFPNVFGPLSEMTHQSLRFQFTNERSELPERRWQGAHDLGAHHSRKFIHPNPVEH